MKQTMTHRLLNSRLNRLSRLVSGLVMLTSLLGNVSRSTAQSWVDHATVPGGARTVLLLPGGTDTPPPALVGGSGMGGLVAVASDGSSSLLGGAGPGVCRRLGLDPFGGRLFAVGDSWTVQASVDGGTTWTADPRGAFALSSQYSSARGFAADGDGNVFVCGGATDSSGDAHWIVRRRDAWGNWQTLQDLSIKRSDCYASGACVVNGTLFVVGQTANRWTVQRGRNLGAATVAWDTPHTWVPGKSGAAQANAVAADRAGNVYVVGLNASAAFGYEAVGASAALQKSSDGGNTWAAVATFNPAGSGGNRAHDLALDASGNLFLASAASFSYSPKPRTVVSAWKWVVYRQEVTTGAWTAAFPFGTDPSQGSSLAKGLSTDAAGNVFTTGPVTDAAGNSFSVVQRFQMN